LCCCTRPYSCSVQFLRWSPLPSHTNSDGSTMDIYPLQAGGVANAAAQDNFCANTTCIISLFYDQTGNNNVLSRGPPGAFDGPYTNGYDDLASAIGAPVTLNGLTVSSSHLELAIVTTRQPTSRRALLPRVSMLSWTQATSKTTAALTMAMPKLAILTPAMATWKLSTSAIVPSGVRVRATEITMTQTLTSSFIQCCRRIGKSTG
jgi:hypothetical protein